MADYKGKLFHKETAFLKNSYEKRMEEFGFKNISRLELFLWDLELYLQIQEILKDRVALKGGAATQFYLPVEAQRTSIDIDMVFYGTKQEIDETLKRISETLDNDFHYFEFIPHIPKEPKTSLPLFTYDVKVPSVLDIAEIWGSDNKEIPYQRVKIEFILQQEYDFVKIKGLNLFAVQSEYEYNIFSINSLFADKLTTLGPETIGVQDNRMDEQIKQFYDIWMLINYHLDEFNIQDISKKYIARAIQECKSRKIDFDLNIIKVDVYKQLYRLSSVDSGEDPILKRMIDNFKSLYLNAKVEFDSLNIVNAASLVKLLYEELLEGSNLNMVYKAIRIVKKLELDGYSGKEKGTKRQELRDMMIKEFSQYSKIPARILKGKNIIRIFWAIVDKEIINQIEEYVDEII